MITSSKRALPLAESRVLSEYRCTDDVKRALSLFSLLEKLGDYHIKQIDSSFQCVCILIDVQMTPQHVHEQQSRTSTTFRAVLLFVLDTFVTSSCASITIKQTHEKMESIC